MSNPRRTIALGSPYDNGKVPPAPTELSEEERLDRIERQLERINDTLKVIVDLRLARSEDDR